MWDLVRRPRMYLRQHGGTCRGGLHFSRRARARPARPAHGRSRPRAASGAFGIAVSGLLDEANISSGRIASAVGGGAAGSCGGASCLHGVGRRSVDGPPAGLTVEIGAQPV